MIACFIVYLIIYILFDSVSIRIVRLFTYIIYKFNPFFEVIRHVWYNQTILFAVKIFALNLKTLILLWVSLSPFRSCFDSFPSTFCLFYGLLPLYFSYLPSLSIAYCCFLQWSSNLIFHLRETHHFSPNFYH